MPEAFLLFGIVVTIVWLVVGWRAMKAHETLAAEARRANDRMDRLDTVDVSGSMKAQNHLYREFLRDHPEVEELSSKERHERFREWELERG
ncbi:hypothetical protein V2O64_06410 [Verrucomicrobiaceae bacterium 227]